MKFIRETTMFSSQTTTFSKKSLPLQLVVVVINNEGNKTYLHLHWTDSFLSIPRQVQICRLFIKAQRTFMTLLLLIICVYKISFNSG